MTKNSAVLSMLLYENLNGLFYKWRLLDQNNRGDGVFLSKFAYDESICNIKIAFNANLKWLTKSLYNITSVTNVRNFIRSAMSIAGMMLN